MSGEIGADSLRSGAGDPAGGRVGKPHLTFCPKGDHQGRAAAARGMAGFAFGARQGFGRPVPAFKTCVASVKAMHDDIWGRRRVGFTHPTFDSTQRSGGAHPPERDIWCVVYGRAEWGITGQSGPQEDPSP